MTAYTRFRSADIPAPETLRGFQNPPGVKGGGIRVRGTLTRGSSPLDGRPLARPLVRPLPFLARLLFATDSGKEEEEKRTPPPHPALPCPRCGTLPLRSALHSPDPSHALEYHRCFRIAPRCAFYRGFIGSFSRFRPRKLRLCVVTFPPVACGNWLARPVAFL